MTDAVHRSWIDALGRALAGRSSTVLAMPDGAWAGDALWRAADRWRRWLRDGDVRPGDRVLVALPPGPGFVALLIAALCEQVTLAPVAPTADHPAAADAVDARVTVVTCDATGDAPSTRVAHRRTRRPPTPDVRLLLQTSGTSGPRRWIALSDDNLWAVLDSHAPHVDLHDATVLALLPWHHAFGLVIQLLPALLAGATLTREASGGRTVASVLDAARRSGATHLDAVPHTLRLLAAQPDGLALLSGLRGGVVGGAPVDASLAGVLASTRLRVGYGQTEASPGIALGAPGEWSAGVLGRAVGCTVRVDADGVLAFRGRNACAGVWDGGALQRLPPDRWVRTGDLVRQDVDGTLHYEGRLADSFKLANGRPVAAASLEAIVRARYPQVREAMLSSPDGAALLLALTTDEPLPTAAEVAPLLGGLAARPLHVVAVPATHWVRTPKGELDRRFPTGRA